MVADGERSDSDARYNAIADQLDELDVFSVLDLGAAEGYFTARIAHDFGCVVTAIDDNARLAELNTAPNGPVHVINRRVTSGYLEAMPRDDVVVALSVLHHFKDWRAVLRWVIACREFAIIEVPHPKERWLRSAPARHELAAIHDAVAGLPGAVKIAEHERVGRDRTRHARPMFRVPGTVRSAAGTVFSGSKTCSRKLPEHGRGLADQLGYTPFWGSLNLKLDRVLHLGTPELDWRGRSVRGRTRDYQFWNAWLDDDETPIHAMQPGRRGHGPDCIELVSGVKLRDALGLVDGSEVYLDVETAKPVIGARPGRRRGR